MTTDKTNERTVGMELRLYRTERNMSLREASDRIGISENYLSEIERNKKNPNDEIVRNMAILYGLDEKYLFDRFDRIPLVVQEELKENDVLSDFMYKYSNKNLSGAEKKEINDVISKLYKQHFGK